MPQYVVRLPVCLYVTFRYVFSHRLEYFENNSLPSSLQSSSAVISTFMSTVQTTSTPHVWINCCSHSAAYSTSPSRHTTPAISLDLVITRNDTEISDLRIGATLSDHAVIRFTLSLKKSCTSTQAVTSRAWRRLSLDAFTADLTASPLCSDLAALNDLSIDDLVNL